MAEISINGSKRTNFGKGASRRDRVAGLVPAVIYGHNAEPQHVSLPARELGNALKSSNVLLNVSFDGKSELVLPKSVSKNPLTGIFEHVDLLVVRKGEKVKVEVPVHTEGAYDKDGILEHVNNFLQEQLLFLMQHSLLFTSQSAQALLSQLQRLHQQLLLLLKHQKLNN